MTGELERRVKSANLLTQDGQLELVFDRDLSQRLLLDVRAKKEGRMAEPGSSQPTPTEDVSTYEQTLGTPTPGPRAKRPALVWTVAAVLIAALAMGLVILTNDPPPPVATPAETAVETAVEFMDALNAHDAEAMEALSAPEAPIDPSEVEQEGVIGWTYHFTCQVTFEAPVSTFVRCPYSFTNHITEVFGLEPYEGSAARFRIVDGVVVDYSDDEFSDDWQGDGGGLERFHDWMVENFPAEDRAESFYYNYTDEANLEFWKEYIPLLLDSEEASS